MFSGKLRRSNKIKNALSVAGPTYFHFLLVSGKPDGLQTINCTGTTIFVLEISTAEAVHSVEQPSTLMAGFGTRSGHSEEKGYLRPAQPRAQC